MKLYSFKGGIHPPGNKVAAGKPIETLPPPERLIIPLSQNLGAPAEPLVKKGDKVFKGQKIGEARGFISAPVHASTSGVIRSIGDFPHPLGPELPAIEIEADGEDKWREDITPHPDYQSLSPPEIRQIIKEAGLVGMGGATFPTHVKLSPPEGKAIDTLIINGSECEPYLTADHRLMIEETEKILEGARIMAHLLGVKRTIMAIEDNKPDALQKMRHHQSTHNGTEVTSLPVRYPQGAEKQLIKTLLNREVPPGGLPMDVGALVHNVSTTGALYEAVINGRPLIERITTVAGPGVGEAKNLRVRVGTPISKAIEACGGYATPEIAKVIAGGPLMGIAQYTTETPIIKGTSGIIVLTSREVRFEPPRPCIRCGMCARGCPMGLEPHYIADYTEKDRIEMAETYSVMDCIECGSCAYNCPAHRPLVHLAKYAKAHLLAKRKKT